MQQPQTLSSPACNTIELLVPSIIERKPGYLLVGDPFRRLLQLYPSDLVMCYLTDMVQLHSEKQLTIRKAHESLLYGYATTLGEIVLCNFRDAPPPGEEVSDPALVLRAWFLVGNGLLPAGIHDVPEEAQLYMNQSNGR